MEYVHLPESATPPSFWERCQNAYYAFRMRTKPDLAYVLSRIDEFQANVDAKMLTLEEKREAAMVTLQGYEKSCIDSIAGRTENWRELFDQVMLHIDRLSVEDQLTIMQYMFAGNRYVCTSIRFRQWMSTHAESILDHLQE